MKKLMSCAAGVALGVGVVGASVASSPAAEARGCTNCVQSDDAGWGGGGVIARDAGFGGGGVIAKRAG